MIKKFKEWLAIRRIRKSLRGLSSEKQTELIVHAYMQLIINEEVNDVLLKGLNKLNDAKERNEVTEK